jgi:large-conductance mechanosensitive channel
MRRISLGYVLASILLIFIDILGLALLAMGIGQQMAGLMSLGQFIGFVVSFAILTFFSLWFTVALIRNVSE